jgi:hypothetical protein
MIDLVVHSRLGCVEETTMVKRVRFDIVEIPQGYEASKV